MIVRIDFEKMMEIAIEEAKSSIQEGNKGYGGTTDLIPSQCHRYRSIPKAPAKQYHIIPT
jgi:hypothetical protein